MESDELDKDIFIQWLKIKSDAAEKTQSDGGFLVPEYIDVPLPGKRAAFWRFVGRCLYRVGFGSLGYVYHLKGTHPVKTIDYLQGRTRHTWQT